MHRFRKELVMVFLVIFWSSLSTQLLFSLHEVVSGDHSMALPLTESAEPLQDYPSGNVFSNLHLHRKRSRKRAIEKKKPINDHLHALFLSEKPKKDKLVCKRCLKFISDQNYYCDECDEFILHKSCAETPDQIKATAQNCPQYLWEISPKYEFSNTHKCSNCDEFSTSRYDSVLETNLQCGFLPAILHHKWHEHPLNFIIMPHGFSYQYLCCTGGKLGNLLATNVMTAIMIFISIVFCFQHCFIQKWQAPVVSCSARRLRWVHLRHLQGKRGPKLLVFSVWRLWFGCSHMVHTWSEQQHCNLLGSLSNFYYIYSSAYLSCFWQHKDINDIL